MWFDGIELSIDGQEYAVGIPSDEFPVENVEPLVAATIQLLHEKGFEKRLDFVRVVFDDTEFGLADVTQLTGEAIDALAKHMTTFMTSEIRRNANADI